MIDRIFWRHTRIASATVGALAAGLIGYAGSALAEDQPAQAQAPAPGELQEVTVTATRREESIIQVPISITALTSGDLTQHNIQNFADYAKLIPNLSYAYGGTNAVSARSITIRGIAGNGTTAFYIDDTPVPTSIDPRVLDIQRIEVLRGPQGTLFGQSSMGGNVRLITNQPDAHNFYAQYTVQGGYTTRAGSPNGGLSGVVNFVAIPEKLGIRVVAYLQHDGGWLHRTYLNDPYNPANQDFVLAPLTSAYVGGTSHLDDQGRVNSGGASISARMDFTPSITATARVLYQITKQTGFPVQSGMIASPTQSFTNSPVLLDNLPIRMFGFQPWLEDRWYLPSLDLNYAGRGFSLHSSTSYFERAGVAYESDAEGEAQVAIFNAHMPLATFNSLPTQDHIWGNKSKSRRFTEENRVAIDPIPIASLPVTVGGQLGYYWSKNFTGPSGYDVIGCTQTRCSWGDWIGLAAAGVQPTDLDWFVPRGVSYTVDSSWFGEINFKFFEHLTVTVGDRWFHLTTFTPGLTSYIGWTVGFGDPSLNVASPPAPNASHDSGHSPKYSITYEFNPDASVYVSASRGYRGGSAFNPNGTLPTACLDEAAALGIDPRGNTGPDYLWNYEAGTKFRLHSPDMILTAAIYRIDWTHLQQTVFLPCSYGVGFNAGEAMSEGGELELAMNPLPALSVHAGGGYQNAHISQQGRTPSGTPVGKPQGTPLYLVPKWTASTGFVYTFDNEMSLPATKATGHLFISADYSYTGSRLSQNTSSRFSVTIPAYGMVNARVGMRYENSELSLNVDNVANGNHNLTDYVAQGWSQFAATVLRRNTPIPQFYVTKPRTYTLKFEHHL